MEINKEEKIRLFLIIEEEVSKHIGELMIDFEKLLVNIDSRMEKELLKTWYCDKCDFETQSEEIAKEHSKHQIGHTLWVKGEG